MDRAPARLPATRSRSSTTTSRTARPIALRLARDLLRAEPELRDVLLVAACRESYLLDYGNERARFMFNFGDGAVAGARRRRPDAERAARRARDHRRLVLAAGQGRARRLGRPGRLPVPRRRRPGRDEGAASTRSRSPNFVAAARGALERSGATLARRLVPLPAAHEALDVRGAARRARRSATDQRGATSTTPAT